MEEKMRVSVRELVAFSFFSPDILPAADASALLAGTRAHQARQEELEAEIEKTIQHTFDVEGLKLLVYGRMDAFTDGEIPLVEEIKLAASCRAEALPEHRAQALCYAAMLALEKECQSVCFCVSYVDEAGQVLQRFEEQLEAEALNREMQALLAPCVRYLRREAAHRRRRNESLCALLFPFENYRQGQRELAAQVYTAISRRKRLFASLPTGTGKSAAVLFPALKALGEGKTDKVLYLTARNTARQSPLNALERMRKTGMQARCCVLSSKEKLCPNPVRCHPDNCDRAGGHYLRQNQAIESLLSSEEMLWDEAMIRTWADRYRICPFEFALALTELADVVMMDLNYVFDPFAQIKRLIQRKNRCTLLVDEAHHTTDRVRDNLSGMLDSRELARIRTACAKQHGRKTNLYASLTRLLKTLRELECPQEEMQLSDVPAEVEGCARQLLEAAFADAGKTGAQDLIRICMPYLYACEHRDEKYAVLLEKHGRERVLTLYCLLPGREIARLTKNMRGAVFFSATLNPLPAMKKLLGGEEGDACFALSSPFPRENLMVVRKGICTKYEQREHSAEQIAREITAMTRAVEGSCIAYFPSYAYLEMVKKHLQTDELPELWVQTKEMNEEARAAFLQAFDQTEIRRLGLCVLGGLFSEGIDLPGKRLMGAAVVGVGLPVPSVRIQAVRACYEQAFGDGFSYACRIPGMHKVLQAAGRVIRSETDTGLVLLLDERYFEPAYETLLPDYWNL